MTEYDEDSYHETTVIGLDDVHSALQDIDSKLDQIHDAIQSKGGNSDWVFWVVLFMFFVFTPGWAGSRLDRWTDRVWYSLTDSADWKNVDVHKRPSDCDFLRSPIGNKGCTYKKSPYIFGEQQRRALIQQATTDEERQSARNAPNVVIVYWEKKEE